ncbi:MAG: DUF5004 domain-containing protein [Mucilaginibacter sp.]
MRYSNMIKDGFRSALGSGILVALLFASCKTERFNKTDVPANISGLYKLTKATRNGVNVYDASTADTINSGVDYKSFRLNFNADNTYLLLNTIPFIETTNGKWALDDPAYPQRITFTADSGQPITVNFGSSIQLDKRRVVIGFKAGCGVNAYQYYLEKTAN